MGSWPAILIVPLVVHVVALGVAQLLVRGGSDERFVSLLTGVPALIAAILIAWLYCWQRNRLAALTGSLVWLLACSMYVLVTFAFWDG